MSSESQGTEVPSWRRYSGRFAWPTVVLAGVVVASMVTVGIAGALGAIAAPLGFILATLIAYVAFTPMHEAAHGNIAGGARRWRRLDDVVGWAMALVLFAPYPAFRALHLRHHGNTNHPTRDPDLWVAGGNALAVVLRCWTIMPLYYKHYLFDLDRRSAKARRERRLVIGTIAAFGAVLGLGAAFGHLGSLVLFWLAPAYVASGLLALAFDYLPHAPHAVRGRYVDTVTRPGRGLEVLLLGQNYHGVHHLYPRVPFYRYRTVFEEVEGEMAARGSVIRR